MLAVQLRQGDGHGVHIERLPAGLFRGKPLAYVPQQAGTMPAYHFEDILRRPTILIEARSAFPVGGREPGTRQRPGDGFWLDRRFEGIRGRDIQRESVPRHPDRQIVEVPPRPGHSPRLPQTIGSQIREGRPRPPTQPPRTREAQCRPILRANPGVIPGSAPKGPGPRACDLHPHRPTGTGV